MTEYYVLYSVFVSLSLFTHLKNGNASKRELKIINTVCFLCALTLLAFRNETMGIDLQGVGWVGYLRFFDRVAGQSFIEATVEKKHFEYGFTVFVKLVSSIWHNHHFFLAVTAFVSLTPIAVFIGRKSVDPAFSWIIYTSLMPFMLLYSGLRQGLAIGLGVLAIMLAEERKLGWFMFVSLLAFSFHASAILIAFVYPLVKLCVGIKWRLVSIAFLPLVYLFSRITIQFVTSHFPKYAYIITEDGGSYRYFLMLLMIYIFCSVVNANDKSNDCYLNLFFLACAFQMLGLFSETAPRIGFYFIIVLPVLVPNVIVRIKRSRLALIVYSTAVICFVLLAFYSIYTTDWAMAYPYCWFWETVG